MVEESRRPHVASTRPQISRGLPHRSEALLCKPPPGTQERFGARQVTRENLPAWLRAGRKERTWLQERHETTPTSFSQAEALSHQGKGSSPVASRAQVKTPCSWRKGKDQSLYSQRRDRIQSWAQPLGLLLLEEGQDYWESPTSKTETSAYPRLGLSPDTREPHSHPSTPTTRLASTTEPATAVCTVGEARQWERRDPLCGADTREN